MSRRRRLICLGLLGWLGIAAGLAAWLFWPPEPGLTPANFSRVRRGMSYAQVVALLGEPDELPRQQPWSIPSGIWRGNGCVAHVSFSFTDLDVTHGSFLEIGAGRRIQTPDEREPLPSKLRRWLRL